MMSKPCFVGTRVFWGWVGWGAATTLAGTALAFERFEGSGGTVSCGGLGAAVVLHGDAAGSAVGNATTAVFGNATAATPRPPFIAVDLCDAATVWTLAWTMHGLALLGLLAFVACADSRWWLSPFREGYQNFKQTLTLFRWVESTQNFWGPTLDDHRAFVLCAFHNSHWPPRAAVCAWLSENWSTWLHPETRPVWFVSEWRARFPADWLPGDSPVPQTEGGSYDGKLTDLDGWLRENT